MSLCHSVIGSPPDDGKQKNSYTKKEENMNISEVKELFQQGKLRGLMVVPVSHNTCANFPCELCGAEIEEENAAAIVFKDGEQIGDVCPDCLKARPRGAAQRMRDHAVRLRQKAEEIEKYASTVEVLPLEAWSTVDKVKAMTEEERPYA